ncbi:MAG TPA: 16S rRNA (guanine(527)-N(7))-methyltransferase RsmG [Caldimonas sp.]|nr:16S rRNA (guanine(527)-N(7))-methyltransferase RsmG [Caldimonas sp.]
MSGDLDTRLRAQLAQGLGQLGLPATSAQEDALLRYVALLERWSAVYNLTAVRDPEAMMTHHILDCLAAVSPLRRQLALHPHRALIDVGSGAGLPGVVLALMTPDLRVICVDSVGKKVAFIQQVIADLTLKNVEAVHQRVEALREKATVVASRAYASLDKLVTTTPHLLAEGGVWMAMKGKRPDQELAALGTRVDVFHVEPLAVPGLPEDRCLIWMRPAAGR